MSPFEEGRAYCFAAVCQLVGLLVHQQFPFIFLALVAHTEMKFGIQIYYKNIKVKFCFGYNRAIFDRVIYTSWTWKNSNNLQFPFIFFAEIAHTEMKFGIQIHQKNIWVKFCFGYNRTIFDRVMPLDIKKFQLFALSNNFLSRGCTY
jgi:hypothetical protein